LIVIKAAGRRLSHVFRSGRISTAALNEGPMLHIDIPTLEEFKALGDDVETYSVVDEVARRALSTGARVLGARREELPVPGAADRQLWPGRVVTLANLLGIAEIGANELMLTAQIYDHTANSALSKSRPKYAAASTLVSRHPCCDRMLPSPEYP
jgi:hypothetical protein